MTRKRSGSPTASSSSWSSTPNLERNFFSFEYSFVSFFSLFEILFAAKGSSARSAPAGASSTTVGDTFAFSTPGASTLSSAG